MGVNINVLHPVQGSGDIIQGDSFTPRLEYTGSLTNWTYPNILVDFYTKIFKVPYDQTKSDFTVYYETWNFWTRQGSNNSLEYERGGITLPESVLDDYIAYDPSDPNPSQGWTFLPLFFGQAGFTQAFDISLFNFDYEIPGLPQDLGTLNSVSLEETLSSSIEFGGLEWVDPTSATSVNIDDLWMNLAWRERLTAASNGAIKIELKHPDDSWTTLTDDARFMNSNVFSYVAEYQTIGDWKYSSAGLLFNDLPAGTYKLRVTRYGKESESDSFSLFFQVADMTDDSLSVSSEHTYREVEEANLQYASDRITVLSNAVQDPIYQKQLKDANDTLSVISQIDEILSFLRLSLFNVNSIETFSSTNQNPISDNPSDKLLNQSFSTQSSESPNTDNSDDSLKVLSSVIEEFEKLKKLSQFIIYDSLPIFENTYPFQRYSDDKIGIAQNMTLEDVINWKKHQTEDKIGVLSQHPYREVEEKQSAHTTDNLSIIPSLLSYMEWATFAEEALKVISSSDKHIVDKKSIDTSDVIKTSQAVITQDYGKDLLDTLDKIRTHSAHYPELYKLMDKLTRMTLTSLEYFSSINISSENINSNDALNMRSVLDENNLINPKSNVANSAISALSFIAHLKNFGNVCKYILGINPTFTPTISNGAFSLSNDEILLLDGWSPFKSFAKDSISEDLLAMKSNIDNLWTYFVKKYITEDSINIFDSQFYSGGQGIFVNPSDKLKSMQNVKSILNLLKVSNILSTSSASFINKYSTLKDQSDILSVLSQLSQSSKVDYLSDSQSDMIAGASALITDLKNKKASNTNDQIGFLSLIQAVTIFLSGASNLNTIISEEEFSNIINDPIVKNPEDLMEMYSVISDMYTLSKESAYINDSLMAISSKEVEHLLIDPKFTSDSLSVFSIINRLIKTLLPIAESISKTETFSSQAVEHILKNPNDEFSTYSDWQPFKSFMKTDDSSDEVFLQESWHPEKNINKSDHSTDSLRFFQQISLLTNFDINWIMPLLSIEYFVPNNILPNIQDNTDYLNTIQAISHSFHDFELLNSEDKLKAISESIEVIYEKEMIPASDRLKSVAEFIEEKRARINNHKTSILEINESVSQHFRSVNTPLFDLNIQNFFESILLGFKGRNPNDILLASDSYDKDTHQSLSEKSEDKIKISESYIQDKKDKKSENLRDFIQVKSEDEKNIYQRLPLNIPDNTAQIKIIDLIDLYKDAVNRKISTLSYSEFFSSTVQLLGFSMASSDSIAMNDESSQNTISSLSENPQDAITILEGITSDINDRLQAINYLDSRLDAILILDETSGGITYEVPFRDNNIGSIGGRVELPWYSGKVSNTRSNKIKSQEPVRIDSAECFEDPMTELPEKINAIMVNYNGKVGDPGRVHLHANDVGLYTLELGEQVVMPLGGDSTNKGLSPSDIKLSVDNYLENSVFASLDVRVLGNRDI